LHDPAAMWRIYDILYRLFQPLLFRIEPERAHRLTLGLLRLMPQSAALDDPAELHTAAFGVSFSNPLGLAAGMDKNALAIAAWNALGFGFAEIGTITPQPQAGNPLPRIWRIPEHHAMVNRMGFPSEGMEAVAVRLASQRAAQTTIRIAINLGPNRSTPPERIADDFGMLMRRLASYASFVVVNVSSPNTPGLRDFQTPERMRTVITAIRQAENERREQRPLLMKIAPDLDSGMLGEICAAAVELGLAGIVATNTTLRHAEAGVVCPFEGGLSGQPLKSRARQAIAAIFRLTRGSTPIIGVGGIASAEDAYQHIQAGASLVEVYTGLIYQGPGLVGRIKSGLCRLLKRDGFRSITEAVGHAT
jgi:dihydroorotate dehydrogenase